MNKILQLLFILICCSSAKNFAQQKYAVIVGINKYYTSPGIVHSPELHGCVNDALSIKGMLTHRFGFINTNISTFLDEQATKQNVLDALMSVLNKCKSGDALIFYFSGHGVWMSNENQGKLEAVVKQNMNQAMVMSNLYADSLHCLFTDATLKRVFNKFIDKKIIVTSILDCCFSGKMSMDIASPGYINPYYFSQPNDEVLKSIDFSEIYPNAIVYLAQKNKIDNTDSIENSLNAILKDELLNGEDTRSFNLKDAIKINDPSQIPRPSERPNSMFLSLGATNDVEEGLEITDETGTRHGAFTKSLLQTIKNNPSDISINELEKKYNQLMKNQAYSQNPMSFQDSNRLHINLIGLPAENFINTVIANCIQNKDSIIIDAGLNDGLANGNLLSEKRGNDIVTIKIINAGSNTSAAIIVKGKKTFVKPGDKFELTDDYTKSSTPPVLKIFVAGSNISAVAFKNFFNKKIMPLVNLKNYADYEHWYAFPSTQNIFYNDSVFQPEKTALQFLQHKFNDSFLVMLPIPNYIIAPLKSMLQKNQNIQMVNDATDADYVLYLDYIKSRKYNKPGFVFTWYNFHGSEVNQILQFNMQNVKIASMQMTALQIKNVIESILSMLNPLIRMKTNQWINNYPRR